MDPELESGSENELDYSGASEDAQDGEDFGGDTEDELDEDLTGEEADDGNGDPVGADEGADEAPQGEIDGDDLPEFSDVALTDEERERFMTALGEDPLGTIDALVERRVQARLSSNAYANIHLAREAQKNPEFYRLYGPQAQAMLSKMKSDVAASKKGVHMAALGAIAQKVMKTGDLAGTLIEAGRALQKGRTLPAGTTETKPARPLPPEARSPSPNVGKRPAAGARGNGRGNGERVVDALAEMTGAPTNRARRYFEEGD